MARAKQIQNESLLKAALEGLELQRERIEEQLREVRSMLGEGRGQRGRRAQVAAPQKAARKKRVLSSAARKRIAAAQKARWAKFRKGTPANEQ